MSVREKTNYAKKLTNKPKIIVNDDALLIVDENFSLSIYWHNIKSITTDGDFIIIKNNTAEKFSILHTAEFSNNDATIFINDVQYHITKQHS